MVNKKYTKEWSFFQVDGFLQSCKLVWRSEEIDKFDSLFCFIQ